MRELGARLTNTLDDTAIAHLIGAAAAHSDRGDGGALLYLVETPDGSLLFQDTSGHWTGVLDTLAPDVAILAAAGRGTVDGEPVQGSLAGFVADEAQDPGRDATGPGPPRQLAARVLVGTRPRADPSCPGRAGTEDRAARTVLPGGHAHLRRARPRAGRTGP